MDTRQLVDQLPYEVLVRICTAIVPTRLELEFEYQHLREMLIPQCDWLTILRSCQYYKQLFHQCCNIAAWEAQVRDRLLAKYYDTHMLLIFLHSKAPSFLTMKTPTVGWSGFWGLFNWFNAIRYSIDMRVEAQDMPLCQPVAWPTDAAMWGGEW